MGLWGEKNKNKKVGRKIFEKINLPLEATPDFSHFEMNSNKEVIIEGSKGILQYDENVIKINMGKMIVMFCGRKLSLKCLDVDSLVISGFIISIEFIT